MLVDSHKGLFHFIDNAVHLAEASVKSTISVCQGSDEADADDHLKECPVQSNNELNAKSLVFLVVGHRHPVVDELHEWSLAGLLECLSDAVAEDKEECTELRFDPSFERILSEMGDDDLLPRCKHPNRVEKLVEVVVVEDPHRNGLLAVHEPFRLVLYGPTSVGA